MDELGPRGEVRVDAQLDDLATPTAKQCGQTWSTTCLGGWTQTHAGVTRARRGRRQQQTRRSWCRRTWRRRHRSPRQPNHGRTSSDVQTFIRKVRAAAWCCQGKRLNVNVERTQEVARYVRPVFRARRILLKHFEEKSSGWEVRASTRTSWSPADTAMLHVTAAGDAELTTCRPRRHSHAVSRRMTVKRHRREELTNVLANSPLGFMHATG